MCSTFSFLPPLLLLLVNPQPLGLQEVTSAVGGFDAPAGRLSCLSHPLGPSKDLAVGAVESRPREVIVATQLVSKVFR